MNKIPMPLVLTDDDGIRPAGKPDECFYCNQKIGTPHLKDCVCVTKIIKAQYTFTIELEVPYHWDAEQFEYHRNDSSWCANNAISDIKMYMARLDSNCLCNEFKASYIEEVDSTPTVKTQQQSIDLYNKANKIDEEE
jgi:hypothetical protein